MRDDEKNFNTTVVEEEELSQEITIEDLNLSGSDDLDEQGQELLDEYEKSKRKLTGKIALAVTTIGALASLFHFYSIGFKATSQFFLRNVHITLGLMLIPLMYPAIKKHYDRVRAIDWACIAGAFSVFIYLILQDDSKFALRALTGPTTLDIVFGALIIVLILEATRRVIGWPLIIVCGIFFLYTRFANFFPGMFMGKGYSWEKIISYTFSLDGIYGVAAGTSSTYVVLFILFGVFLKNSGAGEFYTNFSYALAGRSRGGPAKVAVVSSALFGTISGSGIANVVTTGSITIPLMKKAGFKGEYAGAVEAVASTGGQIMPPIMGAGAFLLAESIGVPYATVALAATIPALLYFITVFFVVDLQAAKRGLVGLSKDMLPKMGEVMKQSFLVIPLALMIYMLVAGFTPFKSACYSIIAIIIVSWFSKATRMGAKKIWISLADGFNSCMEVIAACSCAGIIMALVALSGIGLKLSTLIVNVSGNNLFVALIFTAVVVIVLSMGLPTTACYIIASTIMAPALIKLGVTPLQSHMFVFYYACLSGIKPPVALTAYPAAAIAKANPITVSFQAFKIGIVGFMVPFIFIYSPSMLMQGTALEIIYVTITALLGVYIVSVAIEGFFKSTIVLPLRLLLFVGGVLMMIPGLSTDLVGTAFVVAAALVQRMLNRKAIPA